jgi:hypothetical protein
MQTRCSWTGGRVLSDGGSVGIFFVEVMVVAQICTSENKENSFFLLKTSGKCSCVIQDCEQPKTRETCDLRQASFLCYLMEIRIMLPR